LEQLDLSFNRLVGAVPSTLGRLTRLRSLWLASNAMHGTIPSHLANAAALQSLWYVCYYLFFSSSSSSWLND